MPDGNGKPTAPLARGCVPATLTADSVQALDAATRQYFSGLDENQRLLSYDVRPLPDSSGFIAIILTTRS